VAERLRTTWELASLMTPVIARIPDWEPAPHDVDEAEEAMFAVAAKSVDEAWLAAWLRGRIRFG